MKENDRQADGVAVGCEEENGSRDARRWPIILGLVLPAVFFASLGRGFRWGVPFEDCCAIPYLGLGVMVFFITFLMGTERIRRVSTWLFPTAFLLLIGVFFWPQPFGHPHTQLLTLSPDMDWKTSWGIQITPALWAIPLLILYLPRCFEGSTGRVDPMLKRIMLCLVASVLVFAEPFFWGGMLMLICGLTTVYQKNRKGLVLIALSVFCFLAFAICFGHGSDILWQYTTQRSSGFVPTASHFWMVLKDVCWFVGDSAGSYYWCLPASDRELVVLGAVCEKGKWVLAAAIVMALWFAWTCWRLYRGKNQGNPYVSGFALFLVIPMMLNLMTVVGIAPLTNIWMPFATESHALMITSWFSLGMLVSAACEDSDRRPGIALKKIVVCLITCPSLVFALFAAKELPKALCRVDPDDAGEKKCAFTVDHDGRATPSWRVVHVSAFEIPEPKGIKDWTMWPEYPIKQAFFKLTGPLTPFGIFFEDEMLVTNENAISCCYTALYTEKAMPEAELKWMAENYEKNLTKIAREQLDKVFEGFAKRFRYNYNVLKCENVYFADSENATMKDALCRKMYVDVLITGLGQRAERGTFVFVTTSLRLGGHLVVLNCIAPCEGLDRQGALPIVDCATNRLLQWRAMTLKENGVK